MTDLLTTFKAAKLAGVSRSEFQQRILSGELNTFEGKIKLDDLVKVFPHVSEHEDPIIQRMEDIKNSACHSIEKKRQEDLPDPECLLDKLQKLSDAFLARHNQALKQEKAIHETLFMLEKMDEMSPQECKETAGKLADWLVEELEKAEEDFRQS